MLKGEDAKLKRWKFAFFTIVGIFLGKKEKTNTCYQRIQKIRNTNFIHSSFTPFL